MINVDLVKSIFNIFTRNECENAEDFIIIARDEITDILLPGANDADVRVSFLCAAMANYRYQQAKSASDDSVYTYAGGVVKAKKNTTLGFAESMLRDYYQLCRKFIKPQNFIFMGISKEEDLKND